MPGTGPPCGSAERGDPRRPWPGAGAQIAALPNEPFTLDVLSFCGFKVRWDVRSTRHSSRFSSRRIRGNRRKGGAMGFLRMVAAVLFVTAGLAFPAAAAAQTPSIKGGGTTEEMTQFALAIGAGRGHFECLM